MLDLLMSLYGIWLVDLKVYEMFKADSKKSSKTEEENKQSIATTSVSIEQSILSVDQSNFMWDRPKVNGKFS